MTHFFQLLLRHQPTFTIIHVLSLCVVVNTHGASSPDSDSSGWRERASRFTFAGSFSVLSEQCAACVASVCWWLLQSASGNKAGTVTHVSVIDVGERRRTCVTAELQVNIMLLFYSGGVHCLPRQHLYKLHRRRFAQPRARQHFR